MELTCEHNCAAAGSPVDLDRYQYGYDRNSNRLWKQNMVAVTNFDEQYTVDNLNRLRDMKRGTLNGSHVIPGTPPRQLAWTLDPTGNWAAYSERTSGSTTLLQTRAASEVNEITDITSYLTPIWATPAYDDGGNMTSFPRACSRQRTTPGTGLFRVLAGHGVSAFLNDVA